MAFQGFLKEDTATTLRLGPFVDKTDGVTYEVGMAAAMNHADTGVRISKNGAALAARTTATEPVYDAFGYYLVNLDATDVGTSGRLKVIFGNAAVCLPCEADFEIIPGNLFDTLLVAQPAAAINKFFDVASSVLTCASVNQAGDAHVHADAIDTLTKASGPGDLAAILLDTGTDGVVVASASKTGFSLSATGADLILKTSTFAAALVAAINELSTYGLTALNTLLVTTGIKAATVPALVAADVRTAVGLASANLDTQLTALDAIVYTVKVDTAAILADTGTDGVVLKAAGLNADAIDKIVDEVMDGTVTLRQAIMLFLSALASKSSGGGTDTLVFRSVANTKPRITATVDANGNRTAMTLDVT